jgi:hypothetical protein
MTTLIRCSGRHWVFVASWMYVWIIWQAFRQFVLCIMKNMLFEGVFEVDLFTDLLLLANIPGPFLFHRKLLVGIRSLNRSRCYEIRDQNRKFWFAISQKDSFLGNYLKLILSEKVFALIGAIIKVREIIFSPCQTRKKQIFLNSISHCSLH